MRSANVLFRGNDMSAVLDSQRAALRQRVEELGAEYISGVDEAELAKSLADQFRIDVPTLQLGERSIEPREERRSEQGDFGPFQYTVNVYTVRIPFTGEAVVFNFQPNQFDLNRPRATIDGQEVMIVLEQKHPDATALNYQLQQTTASIEKYLSWLREMTEPFNAQLVDFARNAITRRKQKVEKDTDVLAALGIPVRRRNAVPSTVSVPVRRTPIPSLKRNNNGPPQTPDPTISESVYRQIIKTMADMALTIERNPTAFEHLNEEQIRFQFLVPLNAIFEGNATAETFSYKGKTDIQIRHEGQPIFTAECKFWTGQKGLLNTIDQLLSYVTWRDTKTAILIFNRQKEFSKILAQIEPTFRNHNGFLRFEGVTHETQFRFVLSHPSDKTRHVIATVLAFDIP